MKLIHRKQLSNYLHARYKEGSCNLSSSLLSHWIHFCFPSGTSSWWQMTHSSCLFNSDLTWTHQLHQILQSFPSFVMWSNFRQLNCLHLEEEVMMFQRPERQWQMFYPARHPALGLSVLWFAHSMSYATSSVPVFIIWQLCKVIRILFHDVFVRVFSSVYRGGIFFWSA